MSEEKKESKDEENSPRLLISDLDGTLLSELGWELRPYLKEFLIQASALGYHLAVWSAADDERINAALKLIWPAELPQPVFIFRQKRCTRKRKYFGIFDWVEIKHKNLKKVWKAFKQYKKEHTLILDNTPTTYANNYGNALHINTFNGTPEEMKEDTELLNVLKKLKLLITVKNVRKIDKINIKKSIEKEEEMEKLME